MDVFLINRYKSRGLHNLWPNPRRIWLLVPVNDVQEWKVKADTGAEASVMPYRVYMNITKNHYKRFLGDRTDLHDFHLQSHLCQRYQREMDRLFAAVPIAIIVDNFFNSVILITRFLQFLKEADRWVRNSIQIR